MKHTHKTFNSAADAALNQLRIECASTMPDKKKFVPIETYISKWVASLMDGDYDDMDKELAVLVLRRAGVEALNWFADNPESNYSHGEMVRTLCSKQHDYGHKNISNFGIIGVAIRICDKIARLHNLESRETPNNESIIDSYSDIVGYAMIAIMLEEESFMLPLAGDR